jgi:hypothetical protein
MYYNSLNFFREELIIFIVAIEVKYKKSLEIKNKSIDFKTNKFYVIVLELSLLRHVNPK